MLSKKEFIEFCKERHDVDVRQRYDGNMLYSKHLEFVVAHFHRFRHLLTDHWLDKGSFTIYDCVEMGCWGHDLIEGTRLTYNDIKDKVGTYVADLIYACTEEKGRTRDERHCIKYYEELALNKEAIFVKLCDIMANATFSVLTNSSMFDKHKKEHEKTRMLLYVKEYDEMYKYLDKIFDLK